jgi:predicted O-methyltransferase YrrM
MLSKLIDAIKSRRVFGAASPIDWQGVRVRTKGMLHRRVYAAIYLAARSAPAGDFVDIGPAQGGTTIALTLGRRDSGLTGKVYSIDRFAGSAALVDRQNQAVNLETLKRNVADLGDPGRSVILVGRPEEVAAQVDSDKLAGIVIDADGAIDRDFSLFFDRLVSRAAVIIDDYEDLINKRATDGYLVWDDERLSQHLQQKGEASLLNYCPLGKHYTTFRLVNFFIDHGFIAVRRLVNNTLFAEKRPEAPSVNSDEVRAAMLRIREEILARFYDERRKRNKSSPTEFGAARFQ